MAAEKAPEQLIHLQVLLRSVCEEVGLEVALDMKGRGLRRDGSEEEQRRLYKDF